VSIQEPGGTGITAGYRDNSTTAPSHRHHHSQATWQQLRRYRRYPQARQPRVLDILNCQTCILLLVLRESVQITQRLAPVHLSSNSHDDMADWPRLGTMCPLLARSGVTLRMLIRCRKSAPSCTHCTNKRSARSRVVKCIDRYIVDCRSVMVYDPHNDDQSAHDCTRMRPCWSLGYRVPQPPALTTQRTGPATPQPPAGTTADWSGYTCL